MNTITTPVVSAITLAFGNAVSKGQLNFAAAIAIEVRAAFLAENSKFKFSDYARHVEKASHGSISEKTVKNCAVVAKAFILKYAAKMEEFGTDEADVLAFANFVSEQVAPTTYKLTLDDLSAFCAGTPSTLDKRNAILQAAIDAEAAKQEKQADIKHSVDAELETVQKSADDAKAAAAKAEEEKAAAVAAAAKAESEKQEAVNRGAALAEESQKQAMEAAAEVARLTQVAAAAEQERKVQESFAINVKVDAEGQPVIIVDREISPAFLEAVAKELKAMAKAKRGTMLKAA